MWLEDRKSPLGVEKKRFLIGFMLKLMEMFLLQWRYPCKMHGNWYYVPTICYKSCYVQFFYWTTLFIINLYLPYLLEAF